MFYSSLIDEKLTLEDIEKFEPKMLDYLTRVSRYSDQDLQDYQHGELDDNGVGYPITTNNRKKLVSLKVNSIFDPNTGAMAAIRRGFRKLMGTQLLDGMAVVKGMANDIREKIKGQFTIDISDLKKHAVIKHPYTAESDQVKWLWEILESLDNPTRLQFIKFITGFSSIPIGGAARFPHPFTILGAKKSVDLLPESNTYFLALLIPQYPTLELFRDKLLQAINENTSC